MQKMFFLQSVAPFRAQPLSPKHQAGVPINPRQPTENHTTLKNTAGFKLESQSETLGPDIEVNDSSSVGFPGKFFVRMV